MTPATFQNKIVVSVGRKHSGKSQLLWDLFTSRAPRVLTIGLIPEDLARDPDVVVTVGMSQLMQALRSVAQLDAAGRFRFPRWHIATTVEPADLRELFTMLCPPLGSPPERSLSKSFGGMAIECCEAYELAPNGRSADEILAAWRRGRHYGLDLYMATQRPASVAREVTALADLIFAFAQREVGDVEYLGKQVNTGFAALVRDLRPEEYRCVRYDVNTGTVAQLDKNRNVVGRSAGSVAVGQ